MFHESQKQVGTPCPVHCLSRLALNSRQSFCLNLPSTEITGVGHHDKLYMISEPRCVWLVGVVGSFYSEIQELYVPGLLLSREDVLSEQSGFLVLRTRDWRKESRIPRLVSGVNTTSAVPHCLALLLWLMATF